MTYCESPLLADCLHFAYSDDVIRVHWPNSLLYTIVSYAKSPPILVDIFGKSQQICRASTSRNPRKSFQEKGYWMLNRSTFDHHQLLDCNQVRVQMKQERWPTKNSWTSRQSVDIIFSATPTQTPLVVPELAENKLNCPEVFTCFDCKSDQLLDGCVYSATLGFFFVCSPNHSQSYNSVSHIKTN